MWRDFVACTSTHLGSTGHVGVGATLGIMPEASKDDHATTHVDGRVRVAGMRHVDSVVWDDIDPGAGCGDAVVRVQLRRIECPHVVVVGGLVPASKHKHDACGRRTSDGY